MQAVDFALDLNSRRGYRECAARQVVDDCDEHISPITRPA